MSTRDRPRADTHLTPSDPDKSATHTAKNIGSGISKYVVVELRAATGYGTAICELLLGTARPKNDDPIRERLSSAIQSHEDTHGGRRTVPDAGTNK